MYYQIYTRQYIRTFHQDKPTLDVINFVFPVRLNDPSRIREALDRYYNHNDFLHNLFLKQRCFKPCDLATHQLYYKFMQDKYPNLSKPECSKYFEQNCWVDVIKVLEWLDGKGEYPSLEKNGYSQLNNLFRVLSQHYSFVPNLQRFLLNYPTYICKLQAERYHYYNNSTINIHHANYCSVIVALEAGCPYLAARFANKFIDRQGDPKWLKSVEHQPKELKPLLPVFRKIVRAPWMLTPEDFQFCKQSGLWSEDKVLSYCMMAIYVNTLATLCLAMGITGDEPCPYLPIEQMQAVKDEYDNDIHESNKQKKQKLKQQIEKTLSENPDPSMAELKELEKKQIQPYMNKIGKQLTNQSLYQKINESINKDNKLIEKHEDFNVRANELTALPCMEQENYLEYTLQQLRDYRNQILDTFLERSYYAKKMTFGNFGHHQSQNTEEFRRSIRYCTEKMLGYTRKEKGWNKKIKKNTKLTMNLRFYIRLLTLGPIYINKQVLDEINHENGNGWIQCFDLGHVAIISAETKARCNLTTVLVNLLA